MRRGRPIAFGDYVLLELLGSGAMGQVHLARRKSGGPNLVIKRLKPVQPEKAHLYERRFRLEAELAVAVDSRHVAKVYEVGSVGDQLYLVMEHIEGWSLRTALTDLITSGDRLSVESAIDVIAGVLVGLDALHTAIDAEGARRGIVHRDVAPKNVMLRKTSGTATLIDLGIAYSRNRDFETRAGVIVGTPGYMAPEQIMGEPIDQRTDLYSTGVMLFEMLAMEPYIRPTTTPEILIQTLRARYRPVAALRKDIPVGLDEVIERSVAIDPRDRWNSAEELLVALRRIVPERSPELAMQTLFAQMRFERLRATEPDTASMELEQTEAVETRVLARAPIQIAPLAPVTPPRRRVALWVVAIALLSLGAALIVSEKPSEPPPAAPAPPVVQRTIPSVTPHPPIEETPPPLSPPPITMRVRRPEKPPAPKIAPAPKTTSAPPSQPDAEAMFARCFILLKQTKGEDKRDLEQLCTRIHHAVRASKSGHEPAALAQLEQELQRYEGSQ